MEGKAIHKTYTKGDTIVHWEPKKCIHSAKCWKGLIQVFNPQNRPWVNMEGASEERIRQQVENCPSAALHWESKSGENPSNTKKAEPMKVTISKNGPYLIKGEVEIVHPDGSTEKKEKMTALCRCGQSSNKPYCDGAHNGADFQG